MSFDRLSFDSDLSDAITIRAKGFGKFEAACIPPLFRLGPLLVDRLLSIDGLEIALSAVSRISKARRDFLLSRLPYWRNWAKNGGGMVRTGESE